MFTEFRLVKTIARPTGNGIGCPRCSSELVDAGTMATGNRKEVRCLICDYASFYNLNTMKLEKNF